MIEQIIDIIIERTHSKAVLDVQKIQSLWSGYGELSRVFLDKSQCIVKLINFPTVLSHPRGWNSNLGHKRKVRSYEVEFNWYQQRNQNIDKAQIPEFLGSGVIDKSHYLILEDLSINAFKPKRVIKGIEVKRCLEWLATFHKAYLNSKPQGLWPIGTYWHLDTRLEELEALKDLELKNAAPKIDQILNVAKYQTIVHGDAKLANFLFNESSVAAVDFQYVGGGVGVKDVAYFLSSIYDENELADKESECLNYYFEILDDPAVEKEWRELYPYAWCDFYRFLQGWSPGHPKINSYSENMKKRVLECL